VPVLLFQGEADLLVLPSSQAACVKTDGGTGTTLDYRTYSGRDHRGLVANDLLLVPELVPWTQDRFEGKAASSTC
jgi:hypothetical protein